MTDSLEEGDMIENYP